ncbi:unnamed protein product [Penicillium egyptiacum]|uniref:U6 snRNA-associated Sm-like protein LSm6 n=1 Tax=Penicillium egyptiacum TaxID=1303716 RepID=A0A9W4KGA0_9EURO|nr:unnamed protein product [Penicillium egyptiacum]
MYAIFYDRQYWQNAMAVSDSLRKLISRSLPPLAIVPHPHRLPGGSIDMENAPTSEGKDPSVFLSEIIGAPVIVKLNSGVVYKGELQSVDGYMNIALEKTEEYVNGKLRRNYGDAFVRGNNVDPKIHYSMLSIGPTYDNLQVDKKDTL